MKFKSFTRKDNIFNSQKIQKIKISKLRFWAIKDKLWI